MLGLMGDVLRRIVEDKRAEVVAARQVRPLARVAAAAGESPEPRDFFAALTRPRAHLRVIAEIKRASPSAGLIRADFDPEALAVAYHEAGAAAISCLTDAKYFQGALDFIGRIKAVMPLPVLRKDFIIDPYQMYESRAEGADAVLLIAECLPGDQLRHLLHLAEELQLTALLEVHDAQSLSRVQEHLGAAELPRVLLGINNRNLKDMTVDLDHCVRMLERVDDASIVVAESGIRTPSDIARLRRAGIHRVLVGEHLMRQPDVGAALRELTGA